MGNGTTETDRGTVALDLLEKGSNLCRNARRPDLAQTIEIAAARIKRPVTVLCVVGEYKQGKSHVINSLLGARVCVVDDDLATAAITIIGYGAETAAVVHRTTDGERHTESIPLDELARFTVETGEGTLPEGVDIVELALPSPVLEHGLAIVDTPGVNSFRPGNDRAVLDFLSYADGLIVVSDASAELSPPELRFLASAQEICPATIVALSKIDLYPEWRRIAEIDRRHLAGIGLDDSLVPISSMLQDAAGADEALQRESGFDRLTATLRQGVLDGSRSRARRRGLGDLQRSLDAIATTYRSTLQALESPAEAEQQLAELKRAEAVVAQLRAASSKWGIALGDGIGDIRTSVDYRIRSAMRQHIQDSDRKINEANVKAEWDELIEDLKATLAVEAEEVFAQIRTETSQVAERIAAMIAEEVPDLPGGERSIDIDDLWSSSDRELTADGPGVIGSGLTVLRGGYSGMLMLTMLANLAGLAVLGPLSIGAGVVFGAKQFRDERKRQQDRQRQEARTVLRQFLDQVQHELATRSHRAIQDAQRSLRDHFAERIRELSATYAHATQVLQEAVDADASRRGQIATATRERLADIDAILAEIEAAR